MTIDDIRKAIEQLRLTADDDDETAHIEEDNLMRSFINHVAENGPSELSEMAKEVLKTKDIQFSRWYA